MNKKLITSLLLFAYLAGSALSLPLSSRADHLPDPWGTFVHSFSNDNNSVTVFCGIGGLLSAMGFDTGPVGTGMLNWVTEDRAWYDQSICQFNEKVFNSPPDQLFGERYTYAQFTWIINSLASYVINFLFSSFPLTAIFAADGPQINHYASNGAIGFTVNLMEAMQTNQISFFHQTLPNFLARFDLATPATAQGYGFQTLQGIQSLWGATRNMSYLIMIIILIVSGFMVMFKVKINPQTAVTIQVMIPKILTTLLGITFSYAISGLIIDLIYVLLGFIIYILPVGAAGTGIFADLGQQGRAFTFFSTPDFGQLYAYYSSFTLPASLVLGAFIPGVGLLVMPMLFAILLFKAFWAMIRAYLMLIVHVITGPLQIMRGLLPNQAGFSQWLRNITAYSVVFLVVPIMLLLNMIIWAGGAIGTFLNNLADIFGDPIVQGVNFENLPSLPLFGPNPANPVMSWLGGQVIQFAMGYAILSMIPSAIDKTIEAFKAVKIGETGDIIGDLQTASLLARQGVGGVNSRVSGAAQALSNVRARMGGGGAPPPSPSTAGKTP